MNEPCPKCNCPPLMEGEYCSVSDCPYKQQSQQEGQDTDSSLQKTIAFTIALSSIITVDIFKANKLADEIVEALNQSPRGITISRECAIKLKIVYQQYLRNKYGDEKFDNPKFDEEAKYLIEVNDLIHPQHTGEQQ